MQPLPFPDTDALPEALRQELARRQHRNVFRMLMHTPDVAQGFLAMTDVLRSHNALPVPLREIAILRVGHRYEAPYEVHHHRRIGRAGGISEAAISAAETGAATPGITADDMLVLQLTDELLDEHGLSDASRARALARFSLTQLADLVLTVGHYQQVCIFLNTFAVPIEPVA